MRLRGSAHLNFFRMLTLEDRQLVRQGVLVCFFFLADARDFLDRCIQNVMDFEKTKAQLQKLTADLPDLGAFLGKMRYGPGPRI